MNIEEIFQPAPQIASEKWQLGSKISREIIGGGIVFIFCSDYRGVRGGTSETCDFSTVRKELYALSNLDFEVPVCDLGDLLSGNSQEDTYYILQEVLSFCFEKKVLPVLVGGSNDLALPLFSALNHHYRNLNYTQISNTVSLLNDGGDTNENNFLFKILTSKNLTLKNYDHLGYQKHLNDPESVRLLKELDFDVIRLAEMMSSTENTEPYFRNADLVTINCDAVESPGDFFSVNPQVNGLNRREVCAYMKEAGLSANLKAAGIFNYNPKNQTRINAQLLAQMLWHMVEGINITKTHPVERNFETFWVIIGEEEHAFRRDTFSGLWWFGKDDDLENCVPCSRADYESAVRGYLPIRLHKIIDK